MTQETLDAITLANIKGLSVITIKKLISEAGSANAVVGNIADIRSIIPEATEKLARTLRENYAMARRTAESEMQFVDKNNIKAISLTDEAYPYRLRECEDAPSVIYFCGNTDFNRKHVVSIVGTRKCTPYGKELCEDFIAGLKQQIPDVLVISGLAYGVDVCAHKASLDNGIDTVGVLAHGLDRIYPAAHRSTAVQMTRNGGLLTEYMSGTTPERQNFVHRNRIVAGMSDATIVIESAIKGGSLITADIASAYNRDLFAFPGRVGDPQSAGCNKLISQCKAQLIQSTDDFLQYLGWAAVRKPTVIEQDLFPELTDEEQLIVNSLATADEKSINQLSVETNLSFSNVCSLMFELELKGIVTVLGGARYKLRRKLL